MTKRKTITMTKRGYRFGYEGHAVRIECSCGFVSMRAPKACTCHNSSKDEDAISCSCRWGLCPRCGGRVAPVSTRKYEALNDAAQWQTFVINLSYVDYLKPIRRLSQLITLDVEAFGKASGLPTSVKYELFASRLVPTIARREDGDVVYLFAVPGATLPHAWNVGEQPSIHAYPVIEQTWRASLRIWQFWREVHNRANA